MSVRVCGAALLALWLAAATASAQEYRNGPRPPGRAEHLDGRFSHNRYYADRGMIVRTLPSRPYVVGGGRYYYSGGVWYAPRGPSFVVVGAPIGFFVPVLPPYYTTIWLGGVPYYYANDTYYMWRADQSGYEVVEPPAGAADPGAAVATQPPPSDSLFIYPQNGQSQDQQSNDKYECHKWANSQTGYDPTQASGGVAPDQTGGRRADYQRAMRACLEGRGYSVR